ncbi:MAG: ferrous iron transport protein A [Syntrophorhabdaceae bacterium]|nr:ferrous iron transport protein A [Syntrophorhabdaceae bacterium]
MLNLSRTGNRRKGDVPATPLSTVQNGKRVLVVAVKAPEDLAGRLAAMGLVPGVPVDVIVNSLKGPFIVVVKGCRLMLSQSMAQGILVA